MYENVKIVISPGAFLLPSVYDEFAKTLKDNHGIDSIAVKHPSANAEDSESITLRHDVDNMRQAILEILDNEKKDVVLFTHSYGGKVGSSACEGLTKAARGEGNTGILRVIYCSAFALKKGQDLRSAAGQEYPHPNFRFEADLMRLHFETEKHQFNDIKAEDLQPFSAHSAAGVFQEGSFFDPASNGVPTTYMVTKLDTILPVTKQEEMKNRIQPDSVYYLESDHYPVINMKEEVAKMVAEVLSK